MNSHLSSPPVRKYPRFKALQRALVLLPLGPEALPCHILDISVGGLSFSYLGEKITPTEISPVNLYHEDELIVSDLPVKTVSDCRLRDVIGEVVMARRRSLCFESLSIEQRNKLSTFIAHFTEH
jgi:hypothetical protein